MRCFGGSLAGDCNPSYPRRLALYVSSQSCVGSSACSTCLKCSAKKLFGPVVLCTVAPDLPLSWQIKFAFCERTFVGQKNMLVFADAFMIPPSDWTQSCL